MFHISRSGLASYIIGLDENSANQRKQVEDLFFPVFSALLDALLLRAQVSSLLVCIAIHLIWHDDSHVADYSIYIFEAFLCRMHNFNHPFMCLIKF